MYLVRVKLREKKNSGCENAPVEILNELRNVKNVVLDNINFEEIHVNLEDFKESNYLIYENSKEIFEMSDRAFFVGGDESICFSIARAFSKILVDGLLVVFDAHTNCENVGWIKSLVENGFNGRDIILIGCRNIDNEEMEFIKKEGITVIKIEVLENDIGEVCDILMERIVNSKGFYVNFNLNVVDPAFAPGVCDIEPGGLNSNELFYFGRRLKLLKNFRGASFVGVNPKNDLNNMTIKFCARLMGEIINTK
ncbi:MAG: arginase family protein [Nanoarchaeota archaeon]